MGRGAWKGAVEGAKDGFISGFVAGGVASGISAMQGNTLFCFVAGTTVLTTLGKKAIETIRVGDTIPCVDHITGEASEKRVVSTSVNKVNTLVELTINGESIQCTDTHPFQVKGKGWVNAGDLQVGDLVYDKEWNTAPVEKVEFLHLAETVEVYNFEVEDYHTYYVGNGLWLVHNACPNGDYYRGGSDFSATPADVKFTSNGLVKTTHGVSVNLDPASAAKHGIPHKVIDLPDGLNIIQRGRDLSHYEIVASYQMSLSKYQELLSKIMSVSIGG